MDFRSAERLASNRKNCDHGGEWRAGPVGSAAEGWPVEASGVCKFGNLQNTEFDLTRRV